MIVTDEAVLRNTDQKSVDLKDQNKLSALLFQLDDALVKSPRPGVGLAAIQLGIPLRVAIVRTPKLRLDLLNPKIVEQSGPYLVGEGCLSVPGRTVSVRRFREVTVENGDGRRYSLEGLEAEVVQHEIQHINGGLILDGSGAQKVGRNDLCPCGRLVEGKRLKFKKCCLVV